jgi:hypothetical protein
MDINRIVFILFLYLVLYIGLVLLKPNILYEKSQDMLRPFGVGYKHTTILPLWFASILLAIFSYFIVLYVIHLRYQTIFIAT